MLNAACYRAADNILWGFRGMTSMNDATATVSTANEGAERMAWVKPEIVSFDAVTATQAATANPGDNFSSNS
jgi:hypothetical protein